ncbi:Mammalian cell entry related domain protein [Desulfovibrio sp. X2]|uniref:MlaD family protein n=1 Tax=Desulfovibrio sp. X2 TaxID=941449 RepID=UPI000358C465|nr:MlaD family protein [Desulfovibrio sp. X2]EPR41092.1 Mammalian cell entry related domain protein [Desulfovibrio sp. X2]
MSRQANATIVGAFVIITIGLVICALVIFGSGRFFKHTKKFVLYFDNSVAGLNTGAPVVFKGVRIGSVTSVRIVANPKTLELSIPVTVEIDPSTIQTTSGKSMEEMPRDDRIVDILIEKGLRARLTMQSFVTGQLMIELAFMPDTPARFRGDGSVPELPTVPSPMDQLAQSLETVPIKEIGKDVADAAKGVSSLVNSPDLRESIVNLNKTLVEMHRLAAMLNAKGAPLADRIDRTVGHVDQLAVNLDQDFRDGRTARLLDSLNQLAARADTVLANVNELTVATKSSVDKFGGAVAENSEVMTDLRKALRELAAASRSLRVWADYLERHPEALLNGKGDGQ